MFTVAIIGPDGAGKTTICRRVAKELPFPARHIYMGINLETSNLMLPTTRLFLELKRLRGKRPDMSGPPDPDREQPRPRWPFGRAAGMLKSWLRMANQLGEEWFRQIAIWFYLRRRQVVLLDRHYFLDYYAHDIAPTGHVPPLHRRIHGFFLNRFYPRPNLVILLDAPGALLFARKGEGTVALLERRRQEYRQLSGIVEHFHTVDASQTEDGVAREVAQLINNFCKAIRRGTTELVGDSTI